MAVLLAAGCAGHPYRRGEEPPPTIRLGPARIALAYDDPREADKRVLLDQINRDRAASGAPPLRYEPRASLVGDLFCLDAAPPRDGHRRTILNPDYTHVGIGFAVAGGEFRLTEEFTRVASPTSRSIGAGRSRSDSPSARGPVTTSSCASSGGGPMPMRG